jgi:hypothetical protein
MKLSLTTPALIGISATIIIVLSAAAWFINRMLERKSSNKHKWAGMIAISFGAIVGLLISLILWKCTTQKKDVGFVRRVTSPLELDENGNDDTLMTPETYLARMAPQLE